MKSLFDVAAAGIDDEIIAIGEFQALGSSKHQIEGSMVGGMIGSMLPGNAKDLGNITGMIAGQQVGARLGTSDEDGNYRWLLAVSPTKVYVLVSANSQAELRGQAKDLSAGAVVLKETFDRAHLDVTVKARVAVRILILEDTVTGTKLELEGVRHGRYHATPVIHALTAHDEAEKPATV